jgi:hypothetical protein
MYTYLSIKSKPFSRVAGAGLILMILVYFVTHIPLWLVATIPVAVLLLYLFSRVGTIQVVHLEDSKSLVIRKRGDPIVLSTPVQHERWWSYAFDSGTDQAEEETPGTKMNDINVYLLLRDRDGSKVVFTEYIGFDTRFPNECAYAPKGVGEDLPVVLVQRVDKLFEFLRNHLTEAELMYSGNPA